MRKNLQILLVLVLLFFIRCSNDPDIPTITKPEDLGTLIAGDDVPDGELASTFVIEWATGPEAILSGGKGLFALNVADGSLRLLDEGPKYRFKQTSDGQYIYYFNSLVASGEKEALYRIKLDGSEKEVVVDVAFINADIVVSTDNRLLAYNRSETGIYLRDLVTGTDTLLRSEGAAIRFSDNGAQLLVATNFFYDDMAILDLSTGDEEIIGLPRPDYLLWNEEGLFFPEIFNDDDGVHIFIHNITLRTSNQLYVKPLDPNTIIPLATFSTDLSQAAYWTNRIGPAEAALYSVDLAKGDEVRVVFTTKTQFLGPLAYAPDNKTLIYILHTNGGASIYKRDL